MNKIGRAAFAFLGPPTGKENSVHTDTRFVKTTFLGSVDYKTDISVENARYIFYNLYTYSTNWTSLKVKHSNKALLSVSPLVLAWLKFIDHRNKIEADDILRYIAQR